jgi:hypothetical protein
VRTIELILALVCAGIIFIALKLVGLVIHIALIGAVVGLVIGFAIARAFRPAS